MGERCIQPRETALRKHHSTFSMPRTGQECEPVWTIAPREQARLKSSEFLHPTPGTSPDRHPDGASGFRVARNSLPRCGPRQRCSRSVHRQGTKGALHTASERRGRCLEGMAKGAGGYAFRSPVPKHSRGAIEPGRYRASCIQVCEGGPGALSIPESQARFTACPPTYDCHAALAARC